MPRTARIVVPGWPHHVTQRGNNRQHVFFTDDDRRAYLSALKRFCTEHGVTVLGYCLMPNHVHLVLAPRAKDGLARAVGATHYRYTQYFNECHSRSGHLWQNRFYSCLLDREHLFNALRYVERNPVRAKLVRAAWLYPWSSALAHVQGVSGTLDLLDVTWWREYARGLDWRAYLVQDCDEAELQHVRSATNRGQPLAGDAVLAKLELKLGRQLRPRPVGRPKNS